MAALSGKPHWINGGERLLLFNAFGLYSNLLKIAANNAKSAIWDRPASHTA
jgi:hypothetical protein